VPKGGDGVGTQVTHLAILHSDWYSGLRDLIVALHWSFLHSSRRVTDLCRQLTSAVRVGSLVICQCPRSWFLSRIILNASRYQGPWVVTWATLEVEAARCLRSAPGMSWPLRSRPLYRVAPTLLVCYWSAGRVVGVWLLYGYLAV
jgi:hypothetical protein